MMGFLGKLFIGILAVAAVLAAVGFWMARRAKKKGEDFPEQEEVLSEKTVGNVQDLNDRFNRARYMDEDGK